MALARSLTACATATAWSCPSSRSGVIQTISMGMPCFSTRSFAATSAPLRADTKMGLVVFFAIITIFKPDGRTGTDVVAGALGCSAPQPLSHPAISVTMSAVLGTDLHGCLP